MAKQKTSENTTTPTTASSATGNGTGVGTVPTAARPSAPSRDGKAATAKLQAPRAAASATWTAVRTRKTTLTAVGAGVVAAGAAAFFAGRRTAFSGQGPVTRATGGRL